MLLPHVRHDEMNQSSRFQHPVELVQDVAGLGSVLEDDNTEHAVEGPAGERQSFQSCNRVEVRVIPCRLALGEIQADIVRMGKGGFESAFARAERIPGRGIPGRPPGGLGI